MLLCPWDSPGKNTGVSCHFLTQGLNPCLLHCQADSLPLHHLGSGSQMRKCLIQTEFIPTDVGACVPRLAAEQGSKCNTHCSLKVQRRWNFFNWFIINMVFSLSPLPLTSAVKKNNSRFYNLSDVFPTVSLGRFQDLVHK